MVMLTAVTLRFPSGSLDGVDYTIKSYLFIFRLLMVRTGNIATKSRARTEWPTVVLGVQDGEGDERQHQC